MSVVFQISGKITEVDEKQVKLVKSDGTEHTIENTVRFNKTSIGQIVNINKTDDGYTQTSYLRPGVIEFDW